MTEASGPGMRRIVLTGDAAKGPMIALLSTFFGMFVGAVFFIAATLGEIFGADGFFMAFAVWALGWFLGSAGTLGMLRRRRFRHLLLVVGAGIQITAGVLVADVAATGAGFLFAMPAAGILWAAAIDWSRDQKGPVPA